jgi:anti-sigma B factor antagonist
VRFNEDVAVLSLSGRFLAGSDGPYLRQKVKSLVEAGSKMLIVDFAEVPYIDSTGLGFLAGARVTVQNANGQIVLANLNPNVRKILDDVNLTQFFVIALTESAAMDLVKQSATSAGGGVAPTQPDPQGKKQSSSASEA